MYEEEEEDYLFVATHIILDKWTGETSGVKVDISVFLEVMVAWVRKVLM